MITIICHNFLKFLSPYFSGKLYFTIIFERHNGAKDIMESHWHSYIVSLIYNFGFYRIVWKFRKKNLLKIRRHKGFCPKFEENLIVVFVRPPPLELLSNFDRILRGQFEVNHFQVRYSTQFFPFVFNSLKCVYLTYFQKLHLASLIAHCKNKWFLSLGWSNLIEFFPTLKDISFVWRKCLYFEKFSCFGEKVINWWIFLIKVS